MAGGAPERLQRDVTTLFQAGTAVGLTDGELIARIAGASDDDAAALFEALVARHGPMVLRVCRNVLSDPNDAEDAFQATFLVLAQRFGTIRRRDSIGSWLYGVAARVSARARVDAARRRKRERERPALAVVAAPDDDAFRDRAVHEEVLRLPERYRSVVVLCYWEGLTHDQAAARLNCPLGTVRSRMARARDLLRTRLVRRGVAIDSTPAILPLSSTLIQKTVQAAATVARGRSLSNAVAAQAAALSLHVVRRMTMAKLGMVAIPAGLAMAASIGLGLAAQTARRADRGDAGRVGPARASKPRAASASRDYIVDPPDLLIVEVLQALPGRPISGERLVRPDGRINLGFYGEVEVAGLSLAEVKEKVVLHLKKYLNDEVLGLVEDGRQVAARDTNRVFIDVSAYNSKVYYVQGAFAAPGRLPSTGRDTVLDVVNYAGGLLPSADHARVFLYRKAPAGGPPTKLRVDVDEVLFGADDSTNFQLQPGDRLVALPKAEPSPNYEPAAAGAGASKDGGADERSFRMPTREVWRSLTAEQKLDVMGLQMIEMQGRLDRILEKLDEP